MFWPNVTQPPSRPLDVWRTGPSLAPVDMPADITAAINTLLRAHDFGNNAFWLKSRDALDAVIIKHLRGEA